MEYVTLSNLIHARASFYGPRPAMRHREPGTAEWKSISWNEFASLVDVCANAMAVLGIEEGERVGVFSQNMPEVLCVNFAIYSNRAVAVPLYATSSSAQVEYIVNDAGIRYLFVGEQYQLDTAMQVVSSCPTLKGIIVFDRHVTCDADCVMTMDRFKSLGEGMPCAALVEGRRAKVVETDLVDILYTSGTTGEPKGVMLIQANYTQAFINHDERLTELSDRDVAMDFLPLTHIFERAWTYFCFHKGTLVCINTHPADIMSSISDIRPTVMCAVPRFWEKVYAAVKNKISQSRGPAKMLMYNAIAVGKAYNIDYRSRGLRPPMWLSLAHWFYDKTIYSRLKRVIGIERGNFFPTAGAAVPDKVFEFCRAVGIRLIVGYGLTESTATVSFTDFEHYVIGSVGEVMPNVMVRVADDGEILLKGATITPGYYNKPEANDSAFTRDGWFRTGDAGRLDGKVLYLTDRLKDLYKTSNGKYIAPQAIESAVVVDRFIDQICVIADRRKYVSALIVPDFGAVEAYARGRGIDCSDKRALVDDPAIIAMIMSRIERLQRNFAHYEQIKRITLLPEPFTMAKGELTNTLKVRRQVVAEHYAGVIDRMYED